MRSFIVIVLATVCGSWAIGGPATRPADGVQVEPFTVHSADPADDWIGPAVQNALQTQVVVATTRPAGTFHISGACQLAEGTLRITGQLTDSAGKVLASLKATGQLGDLADLEDILARQAMRAIAPPPPQPREPLPAIEYTGPVMADPAWRRPEMSQTEWNQTFGAPALGSCWSGVSYWPYWTRGVYWRVCWHRP